MKNLLSFAAFCVAVVISVSFYSCTAQAPQANLKTDIDSLSYAYGVQITQGLDDFLQSQGIEGSNKAEFIKGFLEGAKINKKDKKAGAYQEGINQGRRIANDLFTNINASLFGPVDSIHSLNKDQFLAGFMQAAENKKPIIKAEDAQAFVKTKTDQVLAKVNEKVIAANQAYLDENAKKDSVKTTPSGLQYKVVLEGTGAKPTAPEDTVTVKYQGMTIDGKVFDSSDKAVFPLNHVIKGWTEGIQLMSVGSKYKLYIPADLAYGEHGQRPNIEPYSILIFDVELLNVSHFVPRPAPVLPAPVAKALAPQQKPMPIAPATKK